MKRAGLLAQRLIGLRVRTKECRDCSRYLISAGGQDLDRRAAAAALAVLSAEPMPAKSDAAAATYSGEATTYDITFSSHRLPSTRPEAVERGAPCSQLRN
ncbi:hypothetical protein I551_8387 [Mycobacterium ulcerans str. Harvey]|uniref:Uncharacterized protein n=1 Tax=Mycobacterium ulcerans str. Harvey TaxID=1299332 RepID=A0ABN0QKK6_MYCUL|nr:hypothetical protein I551_8387 [Mycobacterium ulcerans str. Harvey]